ncbi:MAG: sel1 repeat family protein [Firmicutes bacterium]|nr:sel1 repeat family protein [Bacillota bacterium]MCL2256357.1 sel1 repeat family protein [Bacillota bacterium]
MDIKKLISDAEAGDPQSQYFLASCYYSGRGVEKSNELAMEYYLQAADSGHSGAQFNLAMMYEKGVGVTKSPQRAFELYKKSADNGHIHAQFNMGMFYQPPATYPAPPYYTPSNDLPCEVKSFNYYLMAAKQGHEGAQVNVGKFYKYGMGVEQSRDLAMEWFAKAASLDNAQAQYNLGELFFEKDSSASMQNAMKWYEKALLNGYSKAKARIDEIRKRG